MVAKAEFLWAVNHLRERDYYFRTSTDLSRLCTWEYKWSQLFDGNNYAWYALKYIQHLRSMDPKLRFISTNKGIRDMLGNETNIWSEHWEVTKQSLIKYPRYAFSMDDFSFPRNVDFLLDPEWEEACNEYTKFGGTDEESGHISAVVMLRKMIISIIQLHGASVSEGNETIITETKQRVKDIFSHLVAFMFDGIRCTRQESDSLKIPIRLIKGYAMEIGCIGSSIHANQSTKEITENAVDKVLKEEMDSLVSYNSWGNIAYSRVEESDSIPVVHDALSKILNANTQVSLEQESVREVVTVRKQVEDGEISLNKFTKMNKMMNITERTISCPNGFTFVPDSIGDASELQDCCSDFCSIWDKIVINGVVFPIEECCRRCNALICEAGLTDADEKEILYTMIKVPEYGEYAEATFKMLTL